MHVMKLEEEWCDRLCDRETMGRREKAVSE